MDHNLPAVLFAAKSTKDPRGSIPTQLADCRALAEQKGYEVSAELSDEAASAFTGNRGPGLAQAMAECERHAPCALVVQHSDRIARGDHKQAKHLLWYALWAVEHDVTILSAQDPETFRDDFLYAAVTGHRNHEDSKRKGAAVAAGQRRRFERGKRLGSKIRDGYRLRLLEVDSRGNPVREVVLDPDRAPIWRRLFDLVEAGHTPGEVREILNAEGIRMKSGKPWTTRAIRLGVRDDFYAGRARSHRYGKTIEEDHEPLIDPERWERIAAMVKSGRSPRTQKVHRDWLLRGIATCGCCGETLYTRADRTQYVCKSVRESRGTCEALPIPAEQAEQLVLDHLNDFVGGLEEWLSGRTREAAEERDQFAATLDNHRCELRTLDLRAEKADELADKGLDEGDDETASAALRKAEAIRHDRAQLAEAIEAGEARLAEWPTAPDVDAALDYYNELRDAIRGRLSGSQSVTELRTHLRATLEVAALDFDGSDLFGTFLLRSGGGAVLTSGPGLEPIELDREVMDITS